ncbi:hypothetical protein ACFV4P_35485 [Kitasatospora sp. NPDC059795]|uniref:hypothetical protein n=1 Tax=Kitasatospora sp. NPDC059795 TaxID=3346949 RepID=UPI0036553F21
MNESSTFEWGAFGEFPEGAYGAVGEFPKGAYGAVGEFPKGAYVKSVVSIEAVRRAIGSLRIELGMLEALERVLAGGPARLPAQGQHRDEEPVSDADPEGVSSEGVQAKSLTGAQSGQRPQHSPPRSGSMRDAMLNLLFSDGKARSVREIADIIRPGAGQTTRSSIRKTLDRMRKLGEVELIESGIYRAVMPTVDAQQPEEAPQAEAA